MIFYHYTSEGLVESILESGYLKLCESNALPDSRLSGLNVYSQETLDLIKSGINKFDIEDTNALKSPKVVWLFKKQLVGTAPVMLTSKGSVKLFGVGQPLPVVFDKSKIEFTVDIPIEDVQRSDKFFRQFNTPEWWIKGLEQFGGKTGVKDWYVCRREILESEWVEIKDRYNPKNSIKRKK